jgi:hypothetical protein
MGWDGAGLGRGIESIKIKLPMPPGGGWSDG